VISGNMGHLMFGCVNDSKGFQTFVIAVLDK